MTDCIQTTSTIVRNKLAELLVIVDLAVIERLTERERHLVFDWCERAAELAARQQHVPVCEVASVRMCFGLDQIAGVWQAFTRWRPEPPTPPAPKQATLF